VKLHTKQFGTALTKSTMTSDEYKSAVLQAKEHILAGNIFQIVLSQRFERRTYATPFEVYRALRIVNPSPYMAYVQVHIYMVFGYLFFNRLHENIELY
jgi:anthranilate synthase component 1